METPRKRHRTVYPRQRDRAHELLNSVSPPMGVSEIADRLDQEFKESPSERQIRNWVKTGAIYVEPDSAPWTVAHAERPEDIPLVLSALNVFRHPTDKWWPSIARGRWVARLMRAGMEPMDAMTYAGHAVQEDALTFTRRLADLVGEDARTKRYTKGAKE